MKKKLVLFCGILVFVSCGKNVEMQNTIEKTATTKAASKQKFDAELKASDVMLSFNSTEEMDETIAKLILLSEDELTAWYKNANPDFTSQEMIYRNAVDDLNLLENFDEANSFKAKYSPYLLFNNDPADDELYNPYLPSFDFHGLSYVVNKNGDILISGKIVNFNKNVSSVKELEIYKIKMENRNSVQTKSAPYFLNSMYVEKNSRRVLVYAVRQNNVDVGVKVYAELKNWLGWHSYKADWFYELVYVEESTINVPLHFLYNMILAQNYPHLNGVYYINDQPNHSWHPVARAHDSTSLVGVMFYVWSSGLSKNDIGQTFYLVY